MSIPEGSTWAFEGLVVGRKQDSGTNAGSAGFRIRGVIQNAGGLTAMLGATVDVFYETLCNAAAEADDNNDALVIKVEGSRMRWVATVWTTEVMFPE